ncbi:hypothetical protein ACOSOMT5_P0967 [Acidiphilium sp. MT5]
MIIRRLASCDSIEAITALLHDAYAELGRMGLNYTAVDQTDEVTRERIARGDCLVATEDDQLVGTIMFTEPSRTWGGTPWYRRADVAVIGQFGVHPRYQRRGVGVRLLRAAEQLAVMSGAKELALDTAESAGHLVAWYQRQDFRFIEYAQWEGKTYRSVIMSKMVE